MFEVSIIRLTVYNISNSNNQYTVKELKIMEYMSAPETAKKWGISERRVQKLCEENRIPGVQRISRMWLIPTGAKKPIDGRTKQGRRRENE